MNKRNTPHRALIVFAFLFGIALHASEPPNPVFPENTPPAAPQVAVPPLSLEQYVAQLEQLSRAAADMQNHPEKVLEVRASLPREWAVETPGGMIEVPAARIEADLAAMRQQALDLQAAPQGVASATAETKLKEVLSRREFQSVQAPSWWDEQWARFKAWLAEMWNKLFGGLHVSKSVGSAISWTLIGFAFLVLVWVIAKNLLAQSRAFGLHLQAPVRTHQSSREWANAAIAAANSGDFREAIHCAYWAAVYRLDEAGVWTLDPTRTPREYLRLLKQDVPQRPAMREMTRNFEVVWYGTKPASAGDFHLAVGELEKLGCHLPSVAAIESSSSAPA